VSHVMFAESVQIFTVT